MHYHKWWDTSSLQRSRRWVWFWYHRRTLKFLYGEGQTCCLQIGLGQIIVKLCTKWISHTFEGRNIFWMTATSIDIIAFKFPWFNQSHRYYTSPNYQRRYPLILIVSRWLVKLNRINDSDPLVGNPCDSYTMRVAPDSFVMLLSMAYLLCKSICEICRILSNRCRLQM